MHSSEGKLHWQPVGEEEMGVYEGYRELGKKRNESTVKEREKVIRWFVLFVKVFLRAFKKAGCPCESCAYLLGKELGQPPTL